MLDFKQNIKNYTIYISAFNSESWSNSTEHGYMIDLSISYSPNKSVIPPTAPKFLDDPKDYTFSLGKSKEVRSYALPPIFDFNNDNYSVSV